MLAGDWQPTDQDWTHECPLRHGHSHPCAPVPLTLPWLTAHPLTRCGISKGQAENFDFFSVIVSRGWHRKCITDPGGGSLLCFWVEPSPPLVTRQPRQHEDPARLTTGAQPTGQLQAPPQASWVEISDRQREGTQRSLHP